MLVLRMRGGDGSTGGLASVKKKNSRLDNPGLRFWVLMYSWGYWVVWWSGQEGGRGRKKEG